MSGKMVLNGIEYVGNGGGSGGGNVDDVKVNGVSVVDANKEAQIKSYKEITQAQWEALPSTKLTDGIAYFITDSAGADGYPPLIYSDEEREIGVWRDGKPIYQKTFWLSSRTYVTSNYTTILISDITVYSIDNIIEGIGYDNNDGSLALDVVHMIDGTLSFLISNSNKLIVQSPNNNAYCICGFTLKYTKTTDTPGQGIWAGNGAMAHHYSTEEVIVGTWIDGKPLYEKTYELTNLSQDTDNHTIDATLTKSAVSMKHIKKGFYTLGGAYNGDGFGGDDIYANDVTQRLRVFCNSNGLCYSLQNSTYQITRFIITLQYTKTTD